MALSAKPSSTTARDAHISPPSSSATALTISRQSSAPRPAPTRISAFVMSTPSCTLAMTSLTMTLGSVSVHFGANSTTSPVLDASGASMENTFGRMVAICGRVFGQMMVPNRFPPKVGRVTSSSASPSATLVWSISILVASAVRPAFRRAATRGARSRPSTVAPVRKESGLNSVMTCVSASA